MIREGIAMTHTQIGQSGAGSPSVQEFLNIAGVSTIVHIHCGIPIACSDLPFVPGNDPPNRVILFLGQQGRLPL